MGAALLITLREGLEVSLVVAIIAAYLVKTGRSEHLGAMWTGVGAAIAASITTGLLFKAVIGEFEGKWEQAIEGLLAFLAVGVLTWVIFWMRSNARSIAGELHTRIDVALTESPLSLSIIAFIAVAREGFETALFLLGAETGSSSGAAVVLGGVIGLVIATMIGIGFYTGSTTINRSRSESQGRSMIAATGPGSFEWILLAAGGVLTLALLVFFIVVFTRKEQQ